MAHKGHKGLLKATQGKKGGKGTARWFGLAQSKYTSPSCGLPYAVLFAFLCSSLSFIAFCALSCHFEPFIF
jgi:hypothetical protein